MHFPRIDENILLKDLNEEQRRAVLTTEGPVLVIAGAGSGKTRVLTYRIAYLIGVKGIPPSSILAMTFTNKAAQEMIDRLKSLIGSIEGIWAGTFHSVCVKILRRHIKLLGYTSAFSIYDREDQARLIKEINDLVDERPGVIASRISAYKNGKYIPEDEREVELFKRYEETLKRANALDFDDLLLLTIKLFEKHEEVRDIYANRFRYIHVDEYQDTNRSQYIILKHLASKHRNIFVVGDEDQSIYGFRGADIRNILDFENDFEGAKVIRLERNYRSTKTIVRAATSLIAHNRMRKGKRLWTTNKPGKKIAVVEFEDEREEALYVGDMIRESGRNFGDFLVLYRTNAQSRALEEAMRYYGIPHRVIGSIRFYERKEIKDVLAYLKVIVNPDDDVSLLRVINIPPRGIGRKTIEFLKRYRERTGLRLYDVIGMAGSIEELRESTREKLLDFFRFLESLKEEAEKVDAYDITKKLIREIDYLSYLERSGEAWERVERRENVEELLGSIYEFVEQADDPSLMGYLTTVSLLTDIDELEEDDFVVLMTAHNAKGLEYPVVIITGAEEGTFPHISSFYDDFEMEEERRLFHVALTRAKEEVVITYARRRYSRRNMVLGPSRFLSEIDKETLIFIGEEPQTQGEEINKGDRVSHPLFGEGVVLEIYEGKARIKFSNGIKTLVLEYAPLKKI